MLHFSAKTANASDLPSIISDLKIILAEFVFSSFSNGRKKVELQKTKEKVPSLPLAQLHQREAVQKPKRETNTNLLTLMAD